MTPRELLVRAFLAGAADLARRAPLLDRINVFPVVDSDTGRNLRHTIGAAVDALGAPAAAVADEPLADTVGRPLLLAAKGNSGVILSQFLAGFFDALGRGLELDSARFIDAVARGRSLAYGSVARPVEGTMLTTMTDLEALLRSAAPVAHLEAHAALERASAESVARTPLLLPRLAEAGVVDSGALGFHVLASGLSLVLPALAGDAEALARMEARRRGEDEAGLGAIRDAMLPGFAAEHTGRGLEERYCVDLLVELGPAGLPGDWRAPFQRLGSSLESAVQGRLLKLHIHADDPDAVARAGERLGAVLAHSAEDMSAPFVLADAVPEATPAPAPVRVVGDSSMSLSAALAKEHGVTRLENYVNVRGRMIRDAEVDMDELFARMRGGEVFATAQASREEARAFFEAELARAGELVYLAVGPAYTATQETVRGVLASRPENERVAILDSRAASGQQGLACLAVARLAARGATRAECVAYGERQIAGCREYLVIDDLAYLARGGRIGRIKAALVGALSLRPIVGHGGDGAVTHAAAFDHRSALEKIARRAAEHPGDGPLLVLLEYTDNRPWLDEAAAHLATALPSGTEILFSPLSATSAVHMGPGTWGVAVTRL